MANKRQLKKNVRYTCGDLAAEILIASHVYKGFDRKEVVRIVSEIASLQEGTLKHISFSFDKSRASFESASAYNAAKAAYYRTAYKKLMAEFNEKVAAIVKDMNAAMPQAVKDANKGN
ncbi:MAG: hypothetical protein Q4F07_06580 [Bacteroidales bacterium]|nr:hypothetical protein [Bacteroidales bacterium]